MKPIRLCVFCAMLATLPSALAQKWEFGGAVGGGFFTSQTVSGPGGSADANFAKGLVASAWLGNNSGRRLGGELRYDFQMGDMQLSSSGTHATFGAQSHAVHYDFLLHAGSEEARVRPFVAAGAGIKLYRGTGTETVYQPLQQLALLTKTTDLRPLISVGGGVKFRLSHAVSLRVEVHDYLTPFPKEVITPALKASVGGWLQDIVPAIALSVLF